MDRYERALKAFLHEEADRVPIWDYGVDHGVLGRALGIDITSTAQYAEGLVRLGFDMVPVGIGSPKGWKPKRIDERTYVGEWGDINRRTGGINFVVGGTIKDEEDLENFDVPDPCAEGRMDPTWIISRAVGKDTPLIANITDVFEYSYCMRGLVGLLSDYRANKSFAKRLAEISFKFNMEVAKQMCDAGAMVLTTGDDYAYKAGPFMSPAQFREFIFPYLRQMVDLVKKRGVFFVKHCDGYIWPIMNDLLEAGIQGLNPIEGEAGMDLKEVKDKLGERLVLIGNVDCGHVLQFGTEQDTERDVKRCIESAAHGGGYVIASSNTIHQGVKPSNLLTMVREARRYGRYTGHISGAPTS